MAFEPSPVGEVARHEPITPQNTASSHEFAQPAQCHAIRRTTGALALTGAAAIMVLSLGAFVVGASIHEAPANVRVGEMASDFSLRDSTNRRVTLSELTDGRPVLLVFSTGEGVDLPVNAAASALTRSPGTRVVMVQGDAAADTAARRLADLIRSDVVVLADPDHSVADAYGVKAASPMPYAVLVSPDGRIEDRGALEQCLSRLGDS